MEVELLTEKQKKLIKARFTELKMRLQALLGARNEWEKEELGKNRDWRKIALMIDQAFRLSLEKPPTEPIIDKTNRMLPVQYPDCFVCEVMEKKCFIWDGDETHRDCPELLFPGFCYVDPVNDFNRPEDGLFKRQVMHKRSMKRLAELIANSNPDAPAKINVTRYCNRFCKAYKQCVSAETLYEQYLICKEMLEEALKETIAMVDEIIRRCS